MKAVKLLFLVLNCLLLLSCKKDSDTSSTPEPVVTSTGDLNLQVQLYDSLGNVETNRSGVKVLLASSSYSALTDSNGTVSFKGLKYGTYYPSITKDWYEGAPVSVQLNSAAASAILPLARFSYFKLINLSGQVYNKDSIVVSYYLTNSIPAGGSCKLAVISSTAALSAYNFSSVDLISTQTQQVTKQNIAFLPNLRSWLGKIKDSSVFYVDIIPVSYGTYYSNLSQKTVLLGRNPATSNNLPLKKNW